MVTFIGDFQCKLDGKGRFVFPAAFKKVLNGEGEERVVVRRDLFESCLVVFPYAVWEQELNRIRSKLNLYNREHSKFLRDFFKGSVEVSLDGNGRLHIPKRLLDVASIEKDVVLVGVDNKIEIWDLNKYEAQVVNSDDLAGLAEKILGDLDGMND